MPRQLWSNGRVARPCISMWSSTSRSSMSDVPFQRPVVLIGGLHRRHHDRVREFVRALNAPVYAEALSGLRDASELMITAGERMIARGRFDGVIRIGSVPTLRFWRDLDESMKHLPVVSFSDAKFSGLSRGEVRSIEELPDVRARSQDTAFFAEDRRL